MCTGTNPNTNADTPGHTDTDTDTGSCDYTSASSRPGTRNVAV